MADERVYRNELTPVHFLRRSAELFPGRPAVVHDERRLTYGELAERTRRLAGALRGAGLEPGDRVAYLCPNTPAMLEGAFGVPTAGAILVPINIRLTAGEVEYVLEHSGARFAIVDHEFAHLVRDVEGVEVVVDEDADDPANPYERFLLTGSGSSDLAPVTDEEDVISINYTSGTTGRPKGVMVTHRGAFLNALGEVVETGLGYGSVYLWVLPMFHCNGWCHTWRSPPSRRVTCACAASSPRASGSSSRRKA